MTDYQLPEPAYKRLMFEAVAGDCEQYADDYRYYYTADQMQQAYAAGREAMRQECVDVCDKYKNACWAITANIKELK